MVYEAVDDRLGRSVAHDPVAPDPLAVRLVGLALGFLVRRRASTQELPGDLGLGFGVALEIEPEGAVRPLGHVVLEVLDEVQNGGVDDLFGVFQGQQALGSA